MRTCARTGFRVRAAPTCSLSESGPGGPGHDSDHWYDSDSESDPAGRYLPEPSRSSASGKAGIMVRDSDGRDRDSDDGRVLGLEGSLPAGLSESDSESGPSLARPGWPRPGDRHRPGFPGT